MAVVSIGAALRQHARNDPGRVAVRDDQRTLTRADLDVESDRVAATLHGRGVGRGDLVTLTLGNTADFVVTCAALWKLGATPHPISPSAPEREQQLLIDTARPGLVLREPIAPPAPRSRRSGAAGSEAPQRAVFDEISPTWKASSTGGSTGRPKVVLSGSDGTIDPDTPTASFIPAEANHLVVGPLHHSAPFTYAMRGLMLGHELTLLPRFDAARTLQAIEEHRISWLLLVPTTMQRLLRHPDRERTDVSSIETLLHLGAPCPEWLKRAYLDWLGPGRVTEVYAGTESFGLTVIRGDEWLEHPGSVGRPAKGFEFRILGDDGRDLPPNTTGRVFSRPPRGTGSTYRYLGVEPADIERIDGFDTLGDLGHLDDDGYLYLADRSQDVILCGGETVFPAEIEAVLDEHPQVRSSAVIGLPDDDLGERIHAIVDCDASATDLITWSRHRLDRRKVPASIEIVHATLRDDAGKVRRSQLRRDRLPAEG